MFQRCMRQWGPMVRASVYAIPPRNVPPFALVTLRGLGRQGLVTPMPTRHLSLTPCRMTQPSLEASMDAVEELFSIAKDEMEYALESKGTVYYHEDRATAEKAVNECLDGYRQFLDSLPSDEMRQEVQTKIGMKMKEIEMEFASLPAEGE